MRNKNLSIEPAKLEDAAEIIALKNQTWIDTYPNKNHGISEDDVRLRVEGKNGENIEPTIERWKDIIAKSDESSFVLIAKANDKILGMIAPYLSASAENKQQTIGAMYVRQESQGMGIGRKLMLAALEKLDKSNDIYLGVVEYNHKAINFYKKIGFEFTGKKLDDDGFANGVKFPEVEMVLRAQK